MMLREPASYLAALAVAAFSLAGCGSGDDGFVFIEPTDHCPEIYASGFRNPWRWSFDRDTGDLWVGDVGQSAREEVNRVVLGGNYGWRCFEGTLQTPFPCGNESNLLPPVAEYERSVGRSVTGGYVYRGNDIAGLAGRYVFGDFVDKRIHHIDANTPPTIQVTGGLDTTLSISSFGEGNDGELYVVDFAGGQLYQLVSGIPVFTVQQVFTNLNSTFNSPVALLQMPGDDSRWFVVEKGGRVRAFDNDPSATDVDVVVDISTRVATTSEMGLLGMAFHPDFPTDRRVYLSYTNESAGRVSRISEFTSNNGGLTLDPNSERILMVVAQPETNHNGGQVAFGLDGYLYIGMGDGGGANDMHGEIGNGQLMSTLLGKMLRIDVNGAHPYGIPPGNFFPNNALCGAP
jgi:glucose/arabinose dehydrogenase